jgi:thioredoxin reductase
LVIDDGAQSNRAAHAIGGLLGHDGSSPSELYAKARAQVAAYPTVEIREGLIVAGSREANRFVLVSQRGERLEAGRVLLATGMQYEVPALPGVAELWGKDVFHCPYCHGWEVRDRPLGVLGRQGGVHRALLLRGWSADVVLLADGLADLDDAERDRLARARVKVIERRVRGLRARDGRLAAVLFDDGGEFPREGLLVRAPLKPRSLLASDLGAAMTDYGQVNVDGFGQTTVPDLYAAGDICLEVPQVSTAIGAGAVAGAVINDHLLAREHGIEPAFPFRSEPVPVA